MPSFKAGDSSIPTSFTGQPVTLQPRKQEQNGRANQKWAFESDTGIMDAFAAEIRDIGMLSCLCPQKCQQLGSPLPGKVMKLYCHFLGLEKSWNFVEVIGSHEILKRLCNIR